MLLLQNGKGRVRARLSGMRSRYGRSFGAGRRTSGTIAEKRPLACGARRGKGTAQVSSAADERLKVAPGFCDLLLTGCPMECPFCAETIKDEALVCRHCGRDLRVVRPIAIETQQLVTELDQLQLELDRINTQLAFFDRPVRFVLRHAALYILIPFLLLLAAHFVVTVLLDISAVYLRVASVLIPIPFGMMLYGVNKIGLRGAVALGIATAFISVTGMLAVVGYIDKVPILPDTAREWREAIEYALSIVLAYVTGNLLATLILRLLPTTMTASGRPSATAVRLARMLGQHGPDVMRRRARRIQELMKTIGPLAGLVATAGGSIYTGLKGVLGH